MASKTPKGNVGREKRLATGGDTHPSTPAAPGVQRMLVRTIISNFWQIPGPRDDYRQCPGAKSSYVDPFTLGQTLQDRNKGSTCTALPPSPPDSAQPQTGSQ